MVVLYPGHPPRMQSPMGSKKRPARKSAESIRPMTERQLLKEIRPRDAAERFRGEFMRRIPIARSHSPAKMSVARDKAATWLQVPMNAAQLGVYTFPAGPVTRRIA